MIPNGFVHIAKTRGRSTRGSDCSTQVRQCFEKYLDSYNFIEHYKLVIIFYFGMTAQSPANITLLNSVPNFPYRKVGKMIAQSHCSLLTKIE